VTFGEKLRALMAERGRSLRGLAKEIHYDPGYLSKVVNDRKRPPSGMAELLDTALDAGGELVALVPSRRVWNTPAGQAGGITPDDEERLIEAARRPSRVDTAVVGALATVLDGQRRAEDAIGSAAVLAPVRAQLAVVENLLVEARGPIRSGLLDVAAQWAQFGGWLSASTGETRAAARHYDRALQWGAEAGRADMVATALNMKGHLAWVRREVGPMVGLSQAAQRDRHVSDGVLALAVQQEARGHALTGDGEQAGRKLDEALTLTVRAAERQEDQPPWIYFFSTDYLTLQRGLAYRYLGRNQAAAEWLAHGLDALPPESRSTEWTAWYVLQLAIVHLATGDVQQACATAREVAMVARATHSEMLTGQLQALHARMSKRAPGHPDVAELAELLH
jgi:tetratricopeptide (TPR) repeat protein